MPGFHSSDILGFHSCDRGLGLRLINGVDDLTPSDNTWDWLGAGIYFWESDPAHALEYAVDTASGRLKNKKAPETPFVIGSVIQLGNCLNLVEAAALDILGTAYQGLKRLIETSGGEMPVNKGNNRALDCAVINFVHKISSETGEPPYDTIRCAFPEGEAAYPGAMISKRLHIQVCVRNPEMIKGYFLPKPIKMFNPHL